MTERFEVEPVPDPSAPAPTLTREQTSAMAGHCCPCGRRFAHGACWLVCERAEQCLTVAEANAQRAGAKLDRPTVPVESEGG